MAPIYVCLECQVDELGESFTTDNAKESATVRQFCKGLARGARVVEETGTRAATVKTYHTGINRYRKFCNLIAARPFPSTVALMVMFATYCLSWEQLDSSTTVNMIMAVSAWHDYVNTTLETATRQEMSRGWPSITNPAKSKRVRALLDNISKNFKKESKARTFLTLDEIKALWQLGFPMDIRGMHHRLGFMLCIFGMLRQRAATLLIISYSIGKDSSGRPSVKYHDDSDVKVVRDRPDLGVHVSIRVDVDKNVDSRKSRTAYLPEHILGLGIHPVLELDSYLLTVQPPSGGFLLAAPKGLKQRTFNKNPFTAMAKVFTTAFKKVFPGSSKVSLIGSHSGRKSLAQALWNAGYCRRVIADAGGWFIKKEAVDIYFLTLPATILAAIASLGSTQTAPQPGRSD